ncbi:hypothetical protein AUJ10_00765 [Candidatus Pacearchaeota archaeon CG1_02_31_27]|nr:MAG: hypothetical protein AUJ10_00765 [Candidatus Pacearchaeota archaeon CG1_02_31_27]PIN92346.1 MAG: hypothetical protein COU55_00875 [Candidatus Pacearchaeota archaeon CG10_big_fil_rev_8_21_14_0_10_31_59]PIZ80761.1 MAG: hypothetical protein COX99_01755 [Candidatus Pacearchaeota archaeon CG_4_10_14_0_2_um_filter_31_10]
MVRIYFSQDLKKPKRKNWNLTLKLIIANFIIFFLVLILNYVLKNVDLFSYLGLKPSLILEGKYLWTIITSMFMHAGFWHLLVNMLSLGFLGSFLEKLIGSKRFLLAYLVSGIVASLIFVVSAFIFPDSMNSIAVGASGAIFGLGGMLAVLTPKLKVYLFFIPIGMPMWLGVIISLLLMWGLSIVAGLPIGNFAHLGGLIAGAVYGFILRMKYKDKLNKLNNFLEMQQNL